MTDHADLTARLRAAASLSANGGGNWYQLVHRCNEAADALDSADAENARLRDVLTTIKVEPHGHPDRATGNHLPVPEDQCFVCRQVNAAMAVSEEATDG